MLSRFRRLSVNELENVVSLLVFRFHHQHRKEEAAKFHPHFFERIVMRLHLKVHWGNCVLLIANLFRCVWQNSKVNDKSGIIEGRGFLTRRILNAIF